jgi:hypothetical protein
MQSFFKESRLEPVDSSSLDPAKCINGARKFHELEVALQRQGVPPEAIELAVAMRIAPHADEIVRFEFEKGFLIWLMGRGPLSTVDTNPFLIKDGPRTGQLDPIALMAVPGLHAYVRDQLKKFYAINLKDAGLQWGGLDDQGHTAPAVSSLEEATHFLNREANGVADPEHFSLPELMGQITDMGFFDGHPL